MKRTVLFLIMLFLCMLSCRVFCKDPAPLMVATTTSVQTTGFMDYLADTFKKKTGIVVKSVAVGTGEALKMGSRGDVDLVIVHSKPDEDKFVKSGCGIDRKEIMYNYFLIAGPADDPAGIKSARTPLEAFKKIAASKSIFVSRADNSGTHHAELALWKKLNITPKGKWYMESGAGADKVLQIASEKRAYALCDESTFTVMAGKLALKPYMERNSELKNVYSVILVNPEKFPKVHAAEARKFWEFVTGKECQKLIGDFKCPKGIRLFIPINEK
ncbi:MAG: substrate-binding domain-containing protein [Candidatus Xenobiia bacterium LiM19]